MIEQDKSPHTLIGKLKFQTYYKITLSLLVLYLSPLLILGQDSHLRIHDGLIGWHDMAKVLVESGQLIGDQNSIVQAPLNGIPRPMMGLSGFDFRFFLTQLLGSFPTLVINKILIHSIAFFGMYRLLTRHFLNREHDMKILSLGVALCFALLPHYPYIGLGVAAQPLALDAFLTIRKGKDIWTDWLVLTLIPFYSHLYHSFAWFLIFIGLLWAYDLISKKQFNGKFFSSIFFMGTVCLLVNYQTIYGIFIKTDLPSIRVDYGADIDKVPFTLFSVYQIITNILHTFAFSYPYNASLQTFFIIPATIIAIYILFDRRIQESRMLFALALIVLCNFLFRANRNPAVVGLLDLKVWMDINTIYLIPMLWLVVFALALKLIIKHSTRGVSIAVALISLQVALSFFYHPEIQNHRKPSYRELFSVDLFKQIENHIGRPKSEYRVISIGLHPGISLYNGFHTFDGYHTGYPLQHKKAFRKIIAPELAKNEKNRRYFDNWGGRCYVFVDELEYANWLYSKNKNGVIQQLEINTNAFVELGGEYIFSAVEIKNHEENQLALEKVFENNTSPWRIFLYKAQIKSKA